GKLSSWVQMGWPIGFGSAVVAQYFMMPIWGWRSLYFLGMSAILVSAYIKFFVPESPVWLKAQEDKKKGVTGTSAAPAAGLTDLFKSHNIKVFFIVALFFTSMLITYWAVNTWLPTILARERGMNPKEYSGFMMFMQFAAIIAYLIAGIIADKFGKRITMAICAFLSAVTLYVWLGMQWGATVFWVMGTLSWACASAVWAIAMGFVVEQFPTNIRAVGFASSYSTGRLLSTLVPIVMGAAAQKIGLTQVMSSVSVFYLIAMIAILLLKETKANL
ncbi:MAG: MFS transporter, partial [Syntrophales bacterium]